MTETRATTANTVAATNGETETFLLVFVGAGVGAELTGTDGGVGLVGAGAGVADAAVTAGVALVAELDFFFTVFPF